ncbi:MAG: hypothetical protein K5854_02835 [Prevotella sp.]|nr:hypothetical protein [Prevotella sp.]
MDDILNGIRVAAMPNATQYAYIQYVITRCEGDAKVMEKMGSEVKSLKEFFNVEDELMNMVSKTDLLTAQITSVGNERKKLFQSYKKAVDGLTGIPQEDKRKAANNLQKHLATYKINNYAQLDKKTGVYVNFVKDLQTDLKADVELLGLTSFVDGFNDKTEQIRTLIDQRDEENAKVTKQAMNIARKNVENAYLKLKKRLNAYIEIEGFEQYSSFINPINKKIERLKREALRPHKRKQADDKKNDTTDKAKDAKTSGKGKTGKEHKPADTTSNNDGKTELHPSADTQQPSATEQPQSAEPKQDAPKDTNEPKQDTTPQSGEPEPMKPAQ